MFEESGEKGGEAAINFLVWLASWFVSELGFSRSAAFSACFFFLARIVCWFRVELGLTYPAAFCLSRCLFSFARLDRALLFVFQLLSELKRFCPVVCFVSSCPFLSFLARTPCGSLCRLPFELKLFFSVFWLLPDRLGAPARLVRTGSSDEAAFVKVVMGRRVQDKKESAGKSSKTKKTDYVPKYMLFPKQALAAYPDEDGNALYVGASSFWIWATFSPRGSPRTLRCFRGLAGASFAASRHGSACWRWRSRPRSPRKAARRP